MAEQIPNTTTLIDSSSGSEDRKKSDPVSPSTTVPPALSTAATEASSNIGSKSPSSTETETASPERAIPTLANVAAKVLADAGIDVTEGDLDGKIEDVKETATSNPLVYRKTLERVMTFLCDDDVSSMKEVCSVMKEVGEVILQKRRSISNLPETN